jgi:ubiquinone/menaquinone biosynthesis C-methylase UbiE
MGFYAKYLLPRLINSAMKSPELNKIRGQLVPLASGSIIEIGIGSGLNLPYYEKGARIDPSRELQRYAVETARECDVNVEFLAQSGEEIPTPDNEFDTAVVTWTLCTIPDPRRTLAELRRVLKPGGRLIFAEHGLSPERRVARWQSRLNPVWRKIGGGCNLDRKTDELIVSSGFRLSDLSEGYLPGPKFAAYMYRGVAVND